jgi:hypothetical protein
MTLLDITAIVLVLVANLLGVFLVVCSLPGTWLIVSATALAAWWRWDEQLYGWTSLAIVLGLAVLGEILELITGALGARKAGGGTRGAILAMVGGVAGGILGTFFIPLPIVGSILGASLGAFAGALVGESWSGKEVEQALAVGRGAFWGRLVGTATKLAIACLMWIVVAFASFL